MPKSYRGLFDLDMPVTLRRATTKQDKLTQRVYFLASLLGVAAGLLPNTDETSPVNME